MLFISTHVVYYTWNNLKKVLQIWRMHKNKWVDVNINSGCTSDTLIFYYSLQLHFLLPFCNFQIKPLAPTSAKNVHWQQYNADTSLWIKNVENRNGCASNSPMTIHKRLKIKVIQLIKERLCLTNLVLNCITATSIMTLKIN